MRIPEVKINEIRNSTNIIDVIHNHVALKKRGKNFIGLCPFHQEKTPSFTVSEDKQIFHCFGCGKGGDVFKFLMSYKNISFIEAVQEIAEHAGIKLSFANESVSQEQTEQELLYEINVFAAKYFSNNLLISNNGEIARQYFKKRNIKTSTQKTFGLGYAKPEWQDLVSLLTDNNFDLKKAEALGLIDRKTEGGYYDKFRGRVIFPIFSANGRVIAFGGRVFEADKNTAKYLNSQESIIYSKRKSLYGLYHSKDEIRRMDRAILVEGYMDLISLFQNGVKNVVASSGTSLTDEQVQLLSRFTHNIIVLFDADSAGQKAALRSIEILLKQNFEVKVVSLPEGEDPDSYIHKFGKDDFDSLVSKSKNFLEFQTEQFNKSGMLNEPENQAKAIRELVKTIALISDELKRNIYIKTISKKFNLREKLIETELDKYLDDIQVKAIRQVNLKQNIASEKDIISPSTKSEYSKKLSAFEKELITLMFEGNKDILGIIFDHISIDEFENPNVRNLAELVFRNFRNGIISPAALIEQIENEEIKEFVIKLSLNQEVISNHWEEMNNGEKIELEYKSYAKDLVKSYRIAKIDSEIEKLNNELSGVSDDKEIIKTMRLINELQSEKKLIGSGNGNSNY